MLAWRWMDRRCSLPLAGLYNMARPGGWKLLPKALLDSCVIRYGHSYGLRTDAFS